MADALTDLSETMMDGAPLSVRVLRGLSAAAECWRVFEQSCVVTPYQRFEWIRMYVEAAGMAADDVFVALIECGAQPVAILPLLITRFSGLAWGRIPGSDISNCDWLPIDPRQAGRLGPSTILEALQAIRKAAGRLDFVTFYHQPKDWQGVENPLLRFPHQPAPDPIFLGTVEPGPNYQRPPARRMRNIHRGTRRLEESHGSVTLKRATTAGEIEAFQEAFLAQRAARFKEQGIRNIFAEKRFVDFFRHAATASLGKSKPTLRMHAIYAGDEIVAVSIGTTAGTHYSQYIHSITDGPAARYSLMSILIEGLLKELQAEDVRTFDMGVGEFRYKNDWTEPHPVYDSAVGLTPAGRLAARAMMAQRRLKRTIKTNPSLWNFAKGFRGLLASRGRPPAADSGDTPD